MTYEYKVCEYTYSHEMARKMNELAKWGWRVISVIPRGRGSLSDFTFLVTYELAKKQEDPTVQGPSGGK